MTEPSPIGWHGWGQDDLTLSIAPSPDDARFVALIMSDGDLHEVMANFLSEHHAQDVMAFLDGAFRSTAQANKMLAEREVDPDGSEDREE